MNKHNIAAFTPFCWEDEQWIDIYLAEAERLDIPFAIHFDRCPREFKERFLKHPLFLGHTSQDEPKEYTEQHKQGAMDIVRSKGFKWALHWDSDETWDKDFHSKLNVIGDIRGYDYLQAMWVNCWGDRQHIRIDGEFNYPPRVKLYNLQGRRWYFDHSITYGCKMIDERGKVLDGVGRGRPTGIACLHAGLMTPELREFHKARWDRILTQAVGANPYGFWYHACTSDDIAVVVDNPF